MMPNDKHRPSRRDIIKISGGTATGAIIAGCLGKDDGDGGSDNEIGDRTFTIPTPHNPADTHHNPFNNNGPTKMVFASVFDRFGQYDIQNDNFIAGSLSDWSFSTDRFTLNIRDDQEWHNGDAVTAEDLITVLKIQKGLDYNVAPYVDEFERNDDLSVTVYPPEPSNPEIAKHVLLAGSIRQSSFAAPESVYGDYADDLWEAVQSDDEEALEAAQEELITWSPDMEEAWPIGTGPHKLVDSNDTSWILERHDGHPHADAINYSTVEYEFTDDPDQLVLSEKVDAYTSGNMRAETVSQLSDSWVKTDRYITSGLSYMWQLDHPDFERRAVRQALAFVSPQHQVPDLLGETYEPVEYLAGVLEKPERWITDDVLENLRTYRQTDENLELAAELLEQEGYQRDDGEWYRPNGERFSISVLTIGSVQSILVSMEALRDALESFGIEAELESVDGTTYSSRYFDRDYDVIGSKAGGRQFHPYFGFVWDFTSTDATEAQAVDEEYEVPWPPGDWDGDPHTVNLPDTINRLAQSGSAEESREVISELAWTYNVIAHKVPLYMSVREYGIHGDRWEVDEDLFKRIGDVPSYTLDNLGGVSAKTD